MIFLVVNRGKIKAITDLNRVCVDLKFNVLRSVGQRSFCGERNKSNIASRRFYSQMGVFDEKLLPGMHWQQNQLDREPISVYPSRDCSPTLPSCDGGATAPPSQMTDADPSQCRLNNNNKLCANKQTCTNNNCHRRTPITPPTTVSNLPPSCQNLPPCVRSGGFSTNIYIKTSNSPTYLPPADSNHLIPKIEPPSPPSTGPSFNEVAVCAGCGQKISDRFYLQAVDQRWHASCLQCSHCRLVLDGEITCFSRDGVIYCKKDYYKIFGTKCCARCQASISSSELVMRARDLVFHLHCFTCAVCNSPLTKGDHFGMKNAAVLCRLHYDLSKCAGDDASNEPQYPSPYPSPSEFHHQMSPGPHESAIDQMSSGKVPYFNGANAVTATPKQKGRPRKRKPKDLESMTAGLDLNTEYLDMQFGRASPGGTGMHNSRTKRMRTSFKHHQLRTMKSYFAINHNPDAKDLKQLSQKTGLPKRVLQVWFQNARAKWRRMMIKQEGKSMDKCSGSESGLDMDLYPHGPGSIAGSIQSLPPQSPQFMMGESPNSLDCP